MSGRNMCHRTSIDTGWMEIFIWELQRTILRTPWWHDASGIIVGADEMVSYDLFFHTYYFLLLILCHLKFILCLSIKVFTTFYQFLWLDIGGRTTGFNQNITLTYFYANHRVRQKRICGSVSPPFSQCDTVGFHQQHVSVDFYNCLRSIHSNKPNWNK